MTYIIKTYSVWLNQTTDPGDIVVYPLLDASVATKTALLRKEPRALEQRKVIFTWSIGAGTGGGSTCTLDVKGRLSAEDSFVTVLAAPWDEGDAGTYILEFWPEMQFVITALDADGGTGLTGTLTYPSSGAPLARTMPPLPANDS